MASSKGTCQDYTAITLLFCWEHNRIPYKWQISQAMWKYNCSKTFFNDSKLFCVKNCSLNRTKGVNHICCFNANSNLESTKWNDQGGGAGVDRNNSCTENGAFYSDHRTNERERQCGFVSHSYETRLRSLRRDYRLL